jgi:hypothetical protein
MIHDIITKYNEYIDRNSFQETKTLQISGIAQERSPTPDDSWPTVKVSEEDISLIRR